MRGSDTAAARVERARCAQAEWGQLTVDARCGMLERLRHTIAANIDRIVATVSDEVGKTPLDALTGDVMVTLEQLRFYEREAAKILRKRSVGKPPFFFTGARFTESLEPHGLALIFAPWNYPVQLAIVPMVTALFAGNAVLLKCSERAPRTAELIDSLCKEARLPEGLVQVSCEAGDAASALIDARPDFIFFTGSTRIGREVAKKAAAYLIPTALELGGKDACLVFASCDLARSVEGAVYAAFSNAGLVCVGAKRMYVEQSIYEEFLRRFVERAGTLRVGTTVDSDFGDVKFASVRELLRGQVEDAVAGGATLHTAWERDANVLPPLVLTDVAAEARLMTEETFGPVVCIAPFANEDQAVRLANASAYALGASVFTGDAAQGERVAARLNCGACAVNDAIRNIGNPQTSFGGNDGSGHGRYHGDAGLLTFSRMKSVMVVKRLNNPEIHWFPATAVTFRRLRALTLFRHTGESLGRRVKNLLGGMRAQ